MTSLFPRPQVEHWITMFFRSDDPDIWRESRHATCRAAEEDAAESPIPAMYGADYEWVYDHTIHVRIYGPHSWNCQIHHWSPEALRHMQRVELQREQAAATPSRAL